MDPYITIHDGKLTSHFALDEKGELLETVEVTADGQPDWDDAGICDPVRGDDPALQEGIRATLTAAIAHRAAV